MTIIPALSPNHSTRGGNRVRLLVVHATAGLMPGCLSWMRNPASKVSAHYLITKPGTVYRLVDEARSAWHAGAVLLMRDELHARLSRLEGRDAADD